MTIIPGAGCAFFNGRLTIETKLPIYVGASAVACVVGESISFEVQFSNSTTTATYAAIGLPKGLSIHPTTGIISGTVTEAAGTLTSNVFCTNGRGSKTAIITWIVSAVVANVPIITSPTEYSGVGGQAFAYQISANYVTAEYAPVTYAKVSGYADATVNASTGAVTLPGNIWPTTGLASTTITVRATNVNGPCSPDFVITLSATPAPILPPGPVTPNAFTFQEDIAITPVQLSAANVDPVANPGDGFYWTGTTPVGLDLSDAGLLTGTPTTVGTYNVIDVGAYNSVSEGELTGITITITAAPQPPAINSALTLTVDAGANFSYIITATNNPTSYGATGLPSGSSRSGAIISGAVAAGTYNISITATNAAGTSTPATLVLTVSALVNAPVISAPTSMTWTVGVYGEYQIVASNSPTSYAWGDNYTSALGLDCNTVTGLIFGTPTEAESDTYVASATNAGGTGYLAIPFTINPTTAWTVQNAVDAALVAPMQFMENSYLTQTSTTNLDGAGKATFTFSVSPGNAGKYYLHAECMGEYTANNEAWVNVNADPTESNLFIIPPVLETFQVLPVAWNSASSPQEFTLTAGNNYVRWWGKEAWCLLKSVQFVPVVAPTNVIASNLNGQVGFSFTCQLSASGYPTSWTTNPSPPLAGLALNASTGLITGSPADGTAGAQSFTATATNGAGSSAAFTVNLTISAGAAPTIGTASASGPVNTAFSFSISATGNPTSYNATSVGGGALPAGFTVNIVSGLVSVAAQAVAGPISITIYATNGSGTSSRDIVVTILPAGDPDAIIPAWRKTTWEGNVGVQGGIPTRNTIYATLNPGDDINAAIASCPSGQVVYLNAGTYNVSIINLKSNVTLRGAGPTTILNCSSYIGINISGSGIYDPNTQGGALIKDWTGGFAQGTTVITVASASGYSVGDFVCLDQAIDEDYIRDDPRHGSDEGVTQTGRTDRIQFEPKLITGISGNDITIYPPLFMPNYSLSLTPSMWRISEAGNLIENAGVENLYITVPNASGVFGGIYSEYSKNCWAKNITSYNTGAIHLKAFRTMHFEARDNYFSYAVNPGVGSYGMLIWASPRALVENNVFFHISAPILFQQGTSGAVSGYNYASTMYNLGEPNFNENICFNVCHNAFPSYNLWEGNVGTNLYADNIHGGSAYMTLFRNYMVGQEFTKGNFTWPISIQTRNRYYNVVGNVLGKSGYHDTYEIGNQATYKAIYYLGDFSYDGRSGYPQPGTVWESNDSLVALTIIRHGNYDVVNAGQVWESTIPSRVLPNSLYLPAKPSWFGSLTWPPIDPASPSLVSGEAAAELIPAGYRYVNGVAP